MKTSVLLCPMSLTALSRHTKDPAQPGCTEVNGSLLQVAHEGTRGHWLWGLLWIPRRSPLGSQEVGCGSPSRFIWWQGWREDAPEGRRDFSPSSIHIQVLRTLERPGWADPERGLKAHP